MEELIEIHVVFPKELKILVPEKLVLELAQAVNSENLCKTITEALADEIKRLRFRNELEKARGKAV